MIRYLAAATTLKLLPTSPWTKRLYRLIASRFLWKRRVKKWLPVFYVDRARFLLEAVERHAMIQNGGRVLEPRHRMGTLGVDHPEVIL
jgi:hypothetical protein